MIRNFYRYLNNPGLSTQVLVQLAAVYSFQFESLASSRLRCIGGHFVYPHVLRMPNPHVLNWFSLSLLGSIQFARFARRTGVEGWHRQLYYYKYFSIKCSYQMYYKG